jgi:DNA mismatch repair protein MutS
MPGLRELAHFLGKKKRMYEEYIQRWKEAQASYGPATALFLQVGGFYELYDIIDSKTGETQTNVKKVIDILGIQLKVKKEDAPQKQDGYFAGFPLSALHKYAGLLTREYWTVVVVDQLNEMDSKKRMKRVVSRVLSPGTHVESVSTDAFFIAGLWLEDIAWSSGLQEPPHFGATAMDLTTGNVHLFEGRAQDELLHFFQVHPPRELIVWWRGDQIRQPTEAALRRTLGFPSGLLHLRQATSTQQQALEQPSVRASILERCFQPKSLLPLRETLSLASAPRCERALTSLLRFVEDHFPSAVEHLHFPTLWSPTNAVYMGNHALTQLNMITPRIEDSVLGLFSRSFTALGRRALRERILTPLSRPEDLELRYTQLETILAFCPEEQTEFETYLRSIEDLARLHRRISSHTVNASDVLSLDKSYTSATQLQEFLELTPFQRAGPVQQAFASYLTRFHEIFDVEKARYNSDDLFCLQNAVAPRTAAVEAELITLQEKFAGIVERIATASGVPPEAFRPEYRESDVVLATSKAAIRQVQEAIKSGKLPSSFKCHEKKTLNSIESSELTQLYIYQLHIRRKLAAVVNEELGPLCEELASTYTQVWDALESWISLVDVSATLAKTSADNGFCRPKLLQDTGAAMVQIHGLRHPLIEQQQTKIEYVKHDVHLGGEKPAGWLVYGMNASGKSSLMKAVGIAVLLAQAGCYVPATEFAFVPFRKLFTRILNTDNLWAGLSSFAVEMVELREVLSLADSYSLVLGDEVCSGTESVSATALVGSSLQWLGKRSARYIFATHLHGLMDIDQIRSLSDLSIWHLRVRYNPSTGVLQYDRTLQPGAGSSLYGLEVARAMNLPLEVLESAHAIRRGLLGTAAEEEAPMSSWNAEVQRRACERCGEAKTRLLEVHHIQPRSEATASGHFADGSHMNHSRNLMVLCERCHDEHHAGAWTPGPLQQTSEGSVRTLSETNTIVSAATAPRRSKKWSEDQLNIIEGYIRKYPNCPPTRLVHDLRIKEGIQISVSSLRAIRASL